MKRLTLFFLMITASLPGVMAQPSMPDQIRVIPIENAKPDDIASNLGNVMGNQIAIQASDRAVIIRGSAALLDVVEQAVKQLDVAPPSRGVELTMFLLMGVGEDRTDESIPEELNPTIDQLKKVLPYKGYTLMDSMLQRGMDGKRVRVSSVAESDPGVQQPTIIELDLFPKIQVGSNPRRISLENLSLGGRIPIATQEGPETQWQYINVGINTNLDVQEGQYTVVGKTGIGPDRSIVLVILARVVD